MLIAHIVLSVLVALLLTATASGKLAGAVSSRGIRDSLHLSDTAWKAVGVFELVTVIALIVGIWVDTAAIIGAALACVLMLGAAAQRLRAGGAQRTRGVTADAVVLLVAAVTLALAIAR